MRRTFHQIEIEHGSERVRVEVDGELVAESTRPLLLHEAGLPVRYYLPREDVRVELEPSATRTRCPFKGDASHWSAVVAGRRRDDLAWSYEQPLPEVAAIAGLIAFYDEKVDLVFNAR
jgi:uncharacterized protein (DUF427 family)